MERMVKERFQMEEEAMNISRDVHTFDRQIQILQEQYERLYINILSSKKDDISSFIDSLQHFQLPGLKDHEINKRIEFLKEDQAKIDKEI